MQAQTSDIQLPRIEIPQFSGNLDRWTEFKELFGAMVHNNKKLEKIQKFHYLKTHLFGNAALVIRHLQVTAANYESAWSLILKRFNNNRLIIEKNIQRLLELPKVNSENTNEIRSLLDTSKEILYSLQNLGIDIHTWNPLIIYLLVQRMPAESYKLWQQKNRLLYRSCTANRTRGIFRKSVPSIRTLQRK